MRLGAKNRKTKDIIFFLSLISLLSSLSPLFLRFSLFSPSLMCHGCILHHMHDSLWGFSNNPQCIISRSLTQIGKQRYGSKTKTEGNQMRLHPVPTYVASTNLSSSDIIKLFINQLVWVSVLRVKTFMAKECHLEENFR